MVITKGKYMNMFKSLLLSVMCGCVSMINAAQEPSVAKVEDVAIAQGKKQVEKQPVAQDKELAEDTDFKEWAESLGMTEEEQAQFLADMDEALASEVTPTEASVQTETTESVESQEDEPVAAELPNA